MVQNLHIGAKITQNFWPYHFLIKKRDESWQNVWLLPSVINDQMYSGPLISSFLTRCLSCWVSSVEIYLDYVFGEPIFEFFFEFRPKIAMLFLAYITSQSKPLECLILYTKKFWICVFGSPNIYPFCTEIHSFIYILFILGKKELFKNKKINVFDLHFDVIFFLKEDGAIQ